MNEEVLNLLKIPECIWEIKKTDGKPYKNRVDSLGIYSSPIRRALRDEAVGWEKSENVTWSKSGWEPSQKAQKFECIYRYEDFEVMLGKPGKEYFRSKNKNVNDMTPTIISNGKLHDYRPSFTDIFRVLQRFSKFNPGGSTDSEQLGLEILGCIFYRMAYCIDHKHDSDGRYRLTLPEEIIQELVRLIPDCEEYPTMVFVQLLEALAWNEDVKYGTVAHNNQNLGNAKGRRNNLLTYSHYAASLLGRVPWYEIVGTLASRDVAPINLNEAEKLFPFLKSQKGFNRS